jgi:hypothetical protein
MCATAQTLHAYAFNLRIQHHSSECINMLNHTTISNEKMADIAQIADNFNDHQDLLVRPAVSSGNIVLRKVPSSLTPLLLTSTKVRLAAGKTSAELTLDESGMILDCCVTGEGLFEYKRGELIKLHVSKLFPKLSEFSLITDGRINSQLGFLSRCNYPFLTRSADQRSFYSELSFVHLNYDGIKTLRLLVQS